MKVDASLAAVPFLRPKVDRNASDHTETLEITPTRPSCPPPLLCCSAVAEPGARPSPLQGPHAPQAHCAAQPSRRRDCHSAGTPSPSLLKRLLKGEGGAAE